MHETILAVLAAVVVVSSDGSEESYQSQYVQHSHVPLVQAAPIVPHTPLTVPHYIPVNCEYAHPNNIIPMNDGSNPGFKNAFIGKYGNKEYYTVSPPIMTKWKRVKEICKNMTMQMVSIDSWAELDFLSDSLWGWTGNDQSSTSYYWTAGRDRGDASQMFWSTSRSSIELPTDAPAVTNGLALGVLPSGAGGFLKPLSMDECYWYPLCQLIV